jgi:deferrochelatase/peroxidase EfeB
MTRLQPHIPGKAAPELEVSDIQATVLRPRPSPYRGEYVVLRVNDAEQGREMLRRILSHVAPAADWWVPTLPGWLGIAFTYGGLRTLGLPQASLDSFPEEFRQGMAARASILKDVGNNAPANWEYPFGTADMHVPLAIYAQDDDGLKRVLEQARRSHHDFPRIAVVYRLKFNELPEGRNPFAFKDGLHNPHVEGSGAPIRPDHAPRQAAPGDRPCGASNRRSRCGGATRSPPC